MHFLRTCTSRRLFSKTTTIRNLKLQFKNVALCSIFLLDPVSSVQFLGEIISDQSHAFSQKSPLLAKIQSDIIRAALKLNSPELQIFEYPMILSLSLSLSLSIYFNRISLYMLTHGFRSNAMQKYDYN